MLGNNQGVGSNGDDQVIPFCVQCLEHADGCGRVSLAGIMFQRNCRDFPGELLLNVFGRALFFVQPVIIVKHGNLENLGLGIWQRNKDVQDY